MRARDRPLQDPSTPTVAFVANLRPQTIEAFAEQRIQPSAYLLSTHRLSPSTLGHAHVLREQGVPLFADNGSKELLDRVVSDFRDASRSIVQDVREIRRELGRTPRGGDVPPELRQRASDLAREVVAEATRLSEEVDSERLLEQQLDMRPTHLFAQEDFAVGCLLSLNLERETTGFDTEFFRRRNRRSLRLFERVAADPRCRDVNVYAVLSAMDYNTARDAGRLAANGGARHVAVGMAGIMLDATAVEFFVIGTATNRLPEVAPRRYVRLAQVLSGVADGFRAEGARIEAFHALGLGTSTLFPVLAAAFDTRTRLTVDATSPIRDAVFDQVLYDPVGDGSRRSRRAIVTDIVQGRDWPFLCPFCVKFRQEFGHSARAAIDWWDAAGQPAIQSEHLSEARPLAQAVPLFARLNEVTEREAQHTHVAHNHFVVDHLAAEVLWARERRRQEAIEQMEEWQDRASLSVIVLRGLRAAREVLDILEGIEERTHDSGRTASTDRDLSRSRVTSSTMRSETVPATTPAGGWLVPLLDETAAVQRGIVQGEWSQVLTRSVRCLGLGYGALRVSEGWDLGMRRINRAREPIDQSVTNLLAGLARSRRGEQYFTDLRESFRPSSLAEFAGPALQRLRDRMAEQEIADDTLARLLEQVERHDTNILAMDQSLRMLAQGKTTGIPLLEAPQQMATVSLTQPIAEAAIACLSRGLMAWVHAEFNLAIHRHRSLRLASVETETHDVLAIMAERTDEFEARLRSGQSALYGACVSDAPVSDTISLARSVAGAIEAELPGFANLQGGFYSVSQRLREERGDTGSEALGRAALRAGTLTREALATHAAAYRMAAALARDSPDQQVVELRSAAAAVPFQAEIPGGTPVSLGDLPSFPDGAHVEIEGTVHEVDAERSSNQLISRVHLLDPASGAIAKAAALFVNLPNMGVTVDAYCRLHGVFREMSPLLGGPGVQVDRLALTSLSRKSWWIAFLQLADPWFPYWRNNSHIHWSLGPHEDSGDGETHRRGAAEIIFLPVIRP